MEGNCCFNPQLMYDAVKSTKDVIIYTCRTCGHSEEEIEDCSAGC